MERRFLVSSAASLSQSFGPEREEVGYEGAVDCEGATVVVVVVVGLTAVCTFWFATSLDSTASDVVVFSATTDSLDSSAGHFCRGVNFFKTTSILVDRTVNLDSRASTGANKGSREKS